MVEEQQTEQSLFADTGATSGTGVEALARSTKFSPLGFLSRATQGLYFVETFGGLPLAQSCMSADGTVSMIRDRQPRRARPAGRRSSAPRSYAAARGFTITEVMVTLAVLAILISLATPSFREIVLSHGVKSASYDMVSGLLLARSEAITRNTTVTVTPAGGNWGNGWTVTDSGGETVRQQDRFAQVIIAGPGSITFNGAGRLTTGSTSLTLIANGGQASHTRCIEIDLGGRPTSKKGAC